MAAATGRQAGMDVKAGRKAASGLSVASEGVLEGTGRVKAAAAQGAAPTGVKPAVPTGVKTTPRGVKPPALHGVDGTVSSVGGVGLARGAGGAARTV